MFVSILLALVAAVGGHVVMPSDILGGPVSVSQSQPTPAPHAAVGGIHTSDVLGGPVSGPHP